MISLMCIRFMSKGRQVPLHVLFAKVSGRLVISPEFSSLFVATLTLQSVVLR